MLLHSTTWSGLIREVVCLEEDNLVVFQYLSSSRDGLCRTWSGLIREVVCLEEDNLVVFQYLSSSRDGLCRTLKK
jgi:hypothetical protein